MIVERNRVVRRAFNCRMKINYHFKMAQKNVLSQKRFDHHKGMLDKYTADESVLTKDVYAFTKYTNKRRLELQREFNTVQVKRADNRIMSIRFQNYDKGVTEILYFYIADIEKTVYKYLLDREIDNILLS